MMFFTFIKDENGNVIRIGEECSVPPEFQEKLHEYSEAGYVPAEAEEYDEPVLHGAAVTSVEDGSKLTGSASTTE